MARARRGLGDVFHYFISETEQADARARAEPPPAADRTAPRWCVAVDAARPLSAALVADLAATLARSGLPAAILAPAPPSPLSPRSDGVSWRTFGDSDTELAAGLSRLPREHAALVALPSERLAAALGALPPGALHGVIVPVDADPRGLGRSLAVLRQLRGTTALAIGAVVLGAEASTEADVAFRRLRAAAERQLGVAIVPLGELPRDATTFRSLLRGIPVVDLDAEAVSARSLRALADRLLRAETAHPAPA
jgi:hypothetical protein